MSKKKNVGKKPQKKDDFLPLILVISGVVLVLLMVFIFSRNSAGSSTAGVEINQDEIARVSPQEAKAALDAGTALIVDVRDGESFAGSHAAGSINIPWDQLETRLSELDKDKWIIPYCT